MPTSSFEDELKLFFPTKNLNKNQVLENIFEHYIVMNESGAPSWHYLDNIKALKFAEYFNVLTPDFLTELLNRPYNGRKGTAVEDSQKQVMNDSRYEGETLYAYLSYFSKNPDPSFYETILYNLSSSSQDDIKNLVDALVKTKFPTTERTSPLIMDISGEKQIQYILNAMIGNKLNKNAFKKELKRLCQCVKENQTNPYELNKFIENILKSARASKTVKTSVNKVLEEIFPKRSELINYIITREATKREYYIPRSIFNFFHSQIPYSRSVKLSAALKELRNLDSEPEAFDQAEEKASKEGTLRAIIKKYEGWDPEIFRVNNKRKISPST